MDDPFRLAPGPSARDQKRLEKIMAARKADAESVPLENEVSLP